ncbi:hypothetical protein SAMD00019534_079380 [Acytostelium subglobosum LB1]|uniref:hypothetical protein n=1 Tax=Acytostelium subglobosum LB1 TaxID=1410327 RepID=UPI000644CE4A|nr:hypothetical protein SAMD00019534_079380 [Acytostelium subglobosum LB1]GAM24763.1 hypothetical protein SAMD00019534_079380 [Acytostelium subglobosum LB1]|eukprot:XP_012752432.1 hypothetical protein SAMD00019534_079380 [Acytostelium subglobosum LB1]
MERDDISSTNSTDDNSSDTWSLIEEEDGGTPLSPEEMMMKRERMRQQTVNEIVKTETSYVRDLKLIAKLFIDPIRSKISQQEYNDVFGCTERILDQHRDILVEFESIPTRSPTQQNIGEVLYKSFNHKDFTSLYVSFCKHQDTCQLAFDRLRANSKVFATCIDNAKQNYLCRGLTFPMLIIKPVQRITKYPLLLRSLMENTPQDFSDFKALQQAYNKINFVLEEVNHQKRLLDESIFNAIKLKEIENNLSYDDNRPNECTTRRFIKESLISKGHEKESLRCILCSDILIIAKNKKKMATVKRVIVLNRVLVRNKVETIYGSTRGFEMLLPEKDDKIKRFYFAHESEKNEFFQMIYQHSNMNLLDKSWLVKYKTFLDKCSSYGDPAAVAAAEAASLRDFGCSSLKGFKSLNNFANSGYTLEQMQPRRQQQPVPMLQDIFRKSTSDVNSLVSPTSQDVGDHFLSPPCSSSSSSTPHAYTPTFSSISPAINSHSYNSNSISPSSSSTSVSRAANSNTPSTNFTRASSFPSLSQSNEEMRHSPKKMPQTISSITYTSMEEKEYELQQAAAQHQQHPIIPPRPSTLGVDSRSSTPSSTGRYSPLTGSFENLEQEVNSSKSPNRMAPPIPARTGAALPPPPPLPPALNLPISAMVISLPPPPPPLLSPPTGMDLTSPPKFETGRPRMQGGSFNVPTPVSGVALKRPHSYSSPIPPTTTTNNINNVHTSAFNKMMTSRPPIPMVPPPSSSSSSSSPSSGGKPLLGGGRMPPPPPSINTKTRSLTPVSAKAPVHT